MPAQQAAILRLLDDDDVPTVTLVQMKLAETETVEQLRALKTGASGRASAHLEEVIAQIAQKQADAAFSGQCEHFGEHGDLATASWLLAAVFAPSDNFDRDRALLDDWGEEVGRRMSGVLTKADRVRVLAEFLGREMRLRGNDDDYYSIDNSLLPRVVETRLGIPISLTLVYMLVARHAGFQVDGVGLPGHFLARHEDIFFDPFHGGRRLGIEECEALMDRQNLVLTPAHLQPTTPRQMLVRMLTNIYFIAEQSNPPLAAKISEWMDLLRKS